MKTIAYFLWIELWILLLGLVVIVFYRMLTREINMDGLLQDKGGSSGFSPMRLQLLISTIGIAFYYIGECLSSTNTGQFPTIPNEMLYLLGGSHMFYLGSKALALLSESFSISKKR